MISTSLRKDPSYPFLGPAEIATTKRQIEVVVIQSLTDLLTIFRAEHERIQTVTFTFVVDLDGFLHLADRCAEHFDCAFGLPVLSAGEITIRYHRGNVRVVEVTNQSTGYCPDPSSWGSVYAALTRLEVNSPTYWTTAFTLRRCQSCHTCNIVKDLLFECAFCGSDLT